MNGLSKEKTVKKILYLMHINWFWIKQRPQFIAEGLAKNNDVLVMYKHVYNKKGLQKNNISNIKLKEIFTIPNKLKKLKIMQLLNDTLFKVQIEKVIKNYNPQCIYITFPTLVKYIPESYKGNLIYDCMDNHVALETKEKEKESIRKYEEILIKRANKIIVSSRNLENVLKNRYKDVDLKKIYLIRNGFNGRVISNCNLEKTNINPNKISYVGTVSSWFDFKIIEKSLRDFPNIEYYIYGPISSKIKIPINKRIKFLGTVEHKDIYSHISDSVALIMPFKLNDVIESVDPVKLYEYINFNKNIITVRYDEIKRFNNFVYFYNGYDEFKNQLKQILINSNLKYSINERVKFLNENNWDNRVEKIERII